MKLFEYAVIYNPLWSKEEREQGTGPKAELIVDVTRILAKTDKEANMLAARAIPEAYMDRLDRVEVALRPF